VQRWHLYNGEWVASWSGDAVYMSWEMPQVAAHCSVLITAAFNHVSASCCAPHPPVFIVLPLSLVRALASKTLVVEDEEVEVEDLDTLGPQEITEGGEGVWVVCGCQWLSRSGDVAPCITTGATGASGRKG
jgi:hypothetical protein